MRATSPNRDLVGLGELGGRAATLATFTKFAVSFAEDCRVAQRLLLALEGEEP